MKGKMQNFPINLVYILEHAAKFHSEQLIVSLMKDGSRHRYSYQEALKRSKKLANALQSNGINSGDRVATLAWNDFRHFEAWYGIIGQGAICHTVNPRLFADQISFIINDAQDKIVLVDPDFVPLLEGIQEQLTTVERYVVLCSSDDMPATNLNNAICYENYIDEQSDEFEWALIAEGDATSLCYTSGTTGNPKGVLYSHRSNFLMAQAVCGADAFALGSCSNVLAVVPMFHANSWGLVYSVPMVGGKLVLPGSQLDGDSIHKVILDEQINFSAAVPTVWTLLLEHLRSNKLQLPTLKEVVVGGAAVSSAMVYSFKNDFDIQVLHAWGMTEISPLGSLSRPTSSTLKLPQEEQFVLALKQGRPLFGVDMCLKDEQNQLLPHDGKSPGRLFVKGPWIIERYYGAKHSALLDGWFDTGDIATIDEYGFMQITDRAKDIIKSGGEWISSVDLENAAMSHPNILLAAVIGIPDPKWDERPMMLVKLNDMDSNLTAEALRKHLTDFVASWWIPERIEFIDDIPLTATGKINKGPLREKFLEA